MATVTCQYTGIAFEAKSTRQKNHPRVSALLDAAAKNGTYRTAVDRLAEAREAGMTDLDAIFAYVRTGQAEELSAQNQRELERRQALKNRKYDRNDREHTNGILRAGGYEWRKEDEESMDFAGPNAFSNRYGDRSHVWLLIAPDGREVSVHQAMTELAAASNAQAQRWIEEHR